MTFIDRNYRRNTINLYLILFFFFFLLVSLLAPMHLLSSPPAPGDDVVSDNLHHLLMLPSLCLLKWCVTPPRKPYKILSTPSSPTCRKPPPPPWPCPAGRRHTPGDPLQLPGARQCARHNHTDQGLDLEGSA